jgi:hypothetical protein
MASAEVGLIDDIKMEFVSVLRPLCERYLGKNITVSLLGESKEDQVRLPLIPKIKKDATSTDDYGKDDRGAKMSLKKEQSQKYDYYFVKELYQSTRKRKANRNDISKWLNVLSQGATREGVYRALVLDQTYRRLENFDESVSANAIEFSNFYFKRFLGRELKTDSLEGLNIYSIKRIAAEKTLEIIDSLYDSGDDVYSWYAVYSSELAGRGKENNVWKKKLRQDHSKLRHYHWAKNVSEQYLKSEILIKLHLFYNTL